MGFDLNLFVSKPPIYLICTICTQICEEPVTCPDDHYFCRQCIESWLEMNESCPIDRSQLKMADLKHHRTLTNWILDQDVRCRHFGHGCQAILKLETHEEHVDTCDYNLSKVRKLNREVNQLKAEVDQLKSEVSQLKSDKATITEIFTEISNEIEKMKIERQQEKTVMKNFSDKFEHFSKLATKFDILDTKVNGLEIKQNERFSNYDVEIFGKFKELSNTMSNNVESVQEQVIRPNPVLITTNSGNIPNLPSVSNYNQTKKDVEFVREQLKTSTAVAKPSTSYDSSNSKYYSGSDIVDEVRMNNVPLEDHQKRIMPLLPDNEWRKTELFAIVAHIPFAILNPNMYYAIPTNRNFHVNPNLHALTICDHIANICENVPKSAQVNLISDNLILAVATCLHIGKNGRVLFQSKHLKNSDLARRLTDSNFYYLVKSGRLMFGDRISKYSVNWYVYVGNLERQLVCPSSDHGRIYYYNYKTNDLEHDL